MTRIVYIDGDQGTTGLRIVQRLRGRQDITLRPLILNDTSTHLSRLSSDWFARAGLHPQARVALNYNDAIRSLVAAGWGASLLPLEDDAAGRDPRLAFRRLSPALWRPLGLAWHPRADDGAVRRVLQALQAGGD